MAPLTETKMKRCINSPHSYGLVSHAIIILMMRSTMHVINNESVRIKFEMYNKNPFIMVIM